VCSGEPREVDRAVTGSGVTQGGLAPRLIAREVAGGGRRERLCAAGANPVAELHEAQCWGWRRCRDRWAMSISR
jgi:hypothetical protein